MARSIAGVMQLVEEARDKPAGVVRWLLKED